MRSAAADIFSFKTAYRSECSLRYAYTDASSAAARRKSMTAAAVSTARMSTTAVIAAVLSGILECAHIYRFIGRAANATQSAIANGRKSTAMYLRNTYTAAAAKSTADM